MCIPFCFLIAFPLLGWPAPPLDDAGAPNIAGPIWGIESLAMAGDARLTLTAVDGAEFRGHVERHTSSEVLWLQAQTSAVRVRRAFAWTTIQRLEFQGKEIPRRAWRSLAQRLVTFRGRSLAGMKSNVRTTGTLSQAAQRALRDPEQF